MDAFYIKKIVIKGLFGTKNVSWDLSSKVNILGGENGSGKSTILKSCYFILKDKCIKEADLAKLSEEISIEFVNGYKLNWNRLAYDSTDYLREDGYFYYMNTNEMDSDGRLMLQRCALTDSEGKIGNIELVYENINTYLINSFEQRMIANDSDKEGKTRIKTYLDRLIYDQLFIRNSRFASVFEKIITASRTPEELQSILNDTEIKTFMQFYATAQKFLKNYSVFINNSIQLKRNGNEKVLSYVDLSMGEKQLILILLMVCNTANDTCIFFMDEPDLGMHVEWKEILIRELNKLNPNMQMIVSTHAPSMVEGWYDNVKEVKQICYND